MIAEPPALRGLLSELASGRALAILTGPGLVPQEALPPLTTRGPIWEGFDASDLASAAAFAADPARVWRFYEWRREAVAATRPGEAHLAIARIQHVLPATSVATLSVDGFHRAAGSAGVAELHGAIDRARCSAENLVVPSPRTRTLGELPPRCPRCGGALRPDVVWAGEPVMRDAWRAAVRAAEESAVYVVAGTAAVVRPADALVLTASRAGAKVIEVNAEPMPESPLVDLSVRRDPSAFFRELVRYVQETLPS